MLLGVNDKHEIMSINGEPEIDGLTLIQVADDTFGDETNPLLFKIQQGENWQMITPRVKVQAWEPGLKIKAGQYIARGGGLFKATKAHVSVGDQDFTLDALPELFEQSLPPQALESRRYGRPQ